jgi:hypothetical protein
LPPLLKETQVTASAAAAPYPQPRTSSAALLAELETIHAEMASRIAALGAVADNPQPSKMEYTSARLRLSQASIDRRSALNRLLHCLGGSPDPAASPVLAKVRTADGELIAHSVKHLARWTAEAVAGDWRGYCEASRSMREHMAGTVTAEAELLKPLCR